MVTDTPFKPCREQTLDEVHLYIDLPPFLLPKNKEALKKTLQPG